MFGYVALFVVLLLNVATAFKPNVTVTCAVAPRLSYSVTLSSGSATGVIFIDGQCEAQNTAETGTYTFDAAACKTGVPALGSEFKLVVQEYSNINLASDYIVKVTCTRNLTSVEKVVTLDTTGEDYDDSDTPTVSPTFSTAVQDKSGASITSGTIGDSVQIILSIPSAEAAVFDYQITTLAVSATATDSVDLISTGCTRFASIVPKPKKQIDGSLTVPITLFIPINRTSPSLPGTSSTTVTFTFTIEVCGSSCTEPVCGKNRRRRRSAADVSNSTLEVDLATSLVVYPAGHKMAEKNALPEEQNQNEVNVCMSKTLMIGVMVALAVTLAVCMCITAWMFWRLRNPTTKGERSVYSNSGYKS